jgi:hypothetical protein
MADQTTGPGSGIPYRKIAQQIVDQDILNGVNIVSKPSQPFLLDLVTLEKLYFQTIPLTVEVNPDSKFVAIESPGRNNPLYQYTGSEDTIEFTLTWYCDDESRLDVILKCKWLEALTKNNGYDEKPHLVQLVFGDLFKDSKFLVEKASYSFGRFNRQFKMLPTFAEQKVTLKRVAKTNFTRTEILKYTF